MDKEMESQREKRNYGKKDSIIGRVINVYMDKLILRENRKWQ